MKLISTKNTEAAKRFGHRRRRRKKKKVRPKFRKSAIKSRSVNCGDSQEAHAPRD